MSITSGVVEKGLLGITTDAPLIPTTQEITRVLEALCRELRIKIKYIFIIVEQLPTLKKLLVCNC